MSIEPNADDVAALVALLACPDCAFKIEGDSSVIHVVHSPTCPRLPAEARAAGLCAYRIEDPQLLAFHFGKESTDDQHE